MSTTTFETWAIVELFGHTEIAGLVTEREVAGEGFLQLDVPEVPGAQAFTKLVHPKSVYAINPCDEGTATARARELKARPITLYIAAERAEQLNLSTRPLGAAPDDYVGDDYVGDGDEGDEGDGEDDGDDGVPF